MTEKRADERKAFIGQGTAAVVGLVKVKPFIGRGTAAVVTSKGKKPEGKKP